MTKRQRPLVPNDRPLPANAVLPSIYLPGVNRVVGFEFSGKRTFFPTSTLATTSSPVRTKPVGLSALALSPAV